MGGAWLALTAALVLASASALAAPRSVQILWSYPASDGYTGIALYHAASQAEIDAGQNLTRVDLGLPTADAQGVASASITLDDQRDYYLALRAYDSTGRESANSRVGFVGAAPSGPPLAEGFESYQGGQDPDDWEDSASGSTALGDAALFETVELSDGTIAFGTTSAEADIHSHIAAGVGGGWSSYEYSGRISSQTLDGEAGVTVLSQFPAALAYYRLARSGGGAFALSVRGGGSLGCAASTSTGVSPQPGVWQRFRVRVTRFDGRNRIRAMVFADGQSAPASWQVDCWDANPTGVASGSVGVYASGAPATWWDDLQVVGVASDGAPPAFPPPTQTPSSPTTDGYNSRGSLLHWWTPGRDVNALGRDFSWHGTHVDVAKSAKGLSQKDVVDGGKSSAFVDLDGASESLGNSALVRYGIGNAWSLAVWVRPDAPGKKKSRYVLDLNGELGTRSENRISLVLDNKSRFAIEVSDASGRTRALSAFSALDVGAVGQRWYHVVAVKSGIGSLVLYVDGKLAAVTDVGVPQQSDADRALRVGTRVKGGSGYGFAGGVHSVGLWNTVLRASEVRALFANGNRGFDPR